ncbi:MAG: carbohydrate kinase family protein [Patescibacteria group bacterium]
MYDVITIGSATRDVFLESPAFKAIRVRKLEHLGFPDGQAECFPLGSKIEVSEPTFTVGGGAANAAVTFARQGLKTASLFKIGKDDESGRAIIADLKKEKITSIPIFDRDAITSYSTILLSPSGERTILNHRGASEDVRIEEVPLNKLIARAGYIVPGAIPFPVIMAIVRKLKKGGALLAMDPSKHYLQMGPKRLKPLLDALDIIKMNREEAAYLTGVDFKDEVKIFKKLDELVHSIAIMTDGPKGMLLSDGKQIYHAGIFEEKEIVDRTGAGDAFGSGLVAALLRSVKIKNQKSKLRNGAKIMWRESDIREAIRLGTANATSVVEYVGAQPGILTSREFKTQKRWKNLKISVKAL